MKKKTMSRKELDKLVKDAESAISKWEGYLNKLLEYRQALASGTTPPGPPPTKPPGL